MWPAPTSPEDKGIKTKKKRGPPGLSFLNWFDNNATVSQSFIKFHSEYETMKQKMKLCEKSETPFQEGNYANRFGKLESSDYNTNRYRSRLSDLSSYANPFLIAIFLLAICFSSHSMTQLSIPKYLAHFISSLVTSSAIPIPQ